MEKSLLFTISHQGKEDNRSQREISAEVRRDVFGVQNKVRLTASSSSSLPEKDSKKYTKIRMKRQPIDVN